MEAALLALLLAALTAAAPHFMPASPPPELPAMTETVPEPAAVPETTDVPEPGFDERTTVRLLDEGTVTELSLHDYLTGVVLQEMPASFAPEALKAQAVAARTFTLRKIDEGGAHEGADVCGDPGCCQSALSGPEARTVYGDG